MSKLHHNKVKPYGSSSKSVGYQKSYISDKKHTTTGSTHGSPTKERFIRAGKKKERQNAKKAIKEEI